jgi:hypothetical protein
MTAGWPEKKTELTASLLVLDVGDDDQEDPTPLLMPVTIQKVSPAGVTLAVTVPMPNSIQLQGRECILHLAEPGNGEVDPIQGKILWSKFSDDSQPQLSLELHVSQPDSQAFTRVGGLVNPTPKDTKRVFKQNDKKDIKQDIKQLWEKFDQVQDMPTHALLVQRLYMAGLVSLLGGVILQLTGNHVYIITGWVLWSVGSLGIASKIMWSIKQKRVAS